ncbi:MAG: site-specific integrase [Betaproteobacteria bacterium]|nr:site-specific integrase [Betaproteobacteria bacterium]
MAGGANELTDRALRKKWSGSDEWFSDGGSRGAGRLVAKLGQSGIMFYFAYFDGENRRRFLPIGRYDPTGKRGKKLQEARDKAHEWSGLYRSGVTDLHGHFEALEAEKEHERKKAADAAARQGSLHALLDAYVASLRAAGKPSAEQVKGIFGRYIVRALPALAEAKAVEIDPGHIQRILARMVKKGITRQVNVLRSYLHAAFAYGGKADHDPRTVAHGGVLFGLKSNPVALVPRIAEYERAGERVLTETELREFWKALEALPVPQGAFLRFNLALGGQRISQLLRAAWADFDFEANTLLLRDSKGRGGIRDHLLPLTPFALEQLAPLRELNADASGPFTGDGKRAMVLETLSVAVREVSGTLKKKQGIAAFQLRDLRRTCETMLAELGISREIRAHVLSHGRASGVQAKHYDRYSYLPEKRRALEAWGARLAEMASGVIRRRKVVALTQRAVA